MKTPLQEAARQLIKSRGCFNAQVAATKLFDAAPTENDPEELVAAVKELYDASIETLGEAYDKLKKILK